MTLKKVAFINSLSCYGKSSVSAALPIMATARAQAAFIPTQMVSTDSLTGDYVLKNLTDEILPIARHWNSENISFDAILISSLTDENQIFAVRNACKLISNNETQIVIDPVMGDSGKLYKNLPKDFPQRMLELCKSAYILIPNITEACLLTGIEYKEIYDEAYIESLVTRLSDITGAKVVLTGVTFDSRKIGVAVYRNGILKYIFCDRLPVHYKGSGDIFSAAFMASRMNGRSIRAAAEIAQNYICSSIKQSYEKQIPEADGIDFESNLPNLAKYLEL